MRHRLSPVVLVVLAAATLGWACQGPAAENLTDPRDILVRTVANTSALRTVTFRAELQVRDPANPGPVPGGVTGGAVEGQADMAANEFSLQILDAGGAVGTSVILADAALFTSNGGSGRWGRTPIEAGMVNPSLLLLGAGLGDGAADGPDVPAILAVAAQDPSIAFTLAGVEDCPAGRCYRTTVEIPPDAVWPLAMRLTGLDRMRGAQPQPPGVGDVPAISLSVLTDTATLRLVELTAGGSLRGVSAQVRIQISNPDGPVAIQAPPPELVDAVNNGPTFGGGAAQPVPAERQPAESAPIPAPAPPGQP